MNQDTETSLHPFHLAIPVDDLAKATDFYGGIMDCTRGRSSDTWIDWNFFGHQLVTHLGTPLGQADKNDVDGKSVPSFHFGIILDWEYWHQLATKLAKAEIVFMVEPGIRFRGQVGEQATMFFTDPAGNAIEIKAFKDPNQIFAVE